MKTRILIVEDDRLTAHIYRTKFESAGFEVEVAPDGQAGFYRAMEKPPSALILDLLLPQMAGLDILRKLRAQVQFQQVPIVVLTNEHLGELARTAAPYAQRVMNKAATKPQDLLEIMEDLLGLHQPPAPSVPPIASRAAAVTPSRADAAPSPATVPPTAPRPPQTSESPARQPRPRETDVDEVGDLATRVSRIEPRLRQLLRAHTSETELSKRREILRLLTRELHGLTGHAGALALHLIAQFSAAVEALVLELDQKPEHLNPSTDRTLALAVDCLSLLFQRLKDPVLREPVLATALAVDDEAISRKAVGTALSRVKVGCVGVGDAATALTLARQNEFDLVILDIHLPDMDGFELCQQFRTLPLHRETTVMFVTSQATFESRTRSVLSGGNDFISKPFLLIELGVKSMAHVITRRLRRSEAREGAGGRAAKPVESRSARTDSLVFDDRDDTSSLTMPQLG